MANCRHCHVPFWRYLLLHRPFDAVNIRQSISASQTRTSNCFLNFSRLILSLRARNSDIDNYVTSMFSQTGKGKVGYAMTGAWGVGKLSITNSDYKLTIIAIYKCVYHNGRLALTECLRLIRQYQVKYTHHQNRSVIDKPSSHIRRTQSGTTSCKVVVQSATSQPYQYAILSHL